MIISHRRTTIIKTLVISITLIAAGIGGWMYLQPISQAADLKNFDPGNIISDTVMSNKNSMTVQQIQAFLESKNSCNNTNTYMASWYPNLQYNIKDGKFVCMAKESFDGQSAAQIIWQVSQDYNINPQVLIVLLEKEQGLVTDTWPNHIQYRAAVGYACPDTAACDSQYYGLKNQLSQAAKLFRTVLDGGWSNYPVGQTYVQYNPTVACGGSVINIQNRATSALYRYTPYQPNQSALNAGYGTGDSCGAYGNRNFWLFFTDWFGSTQTDRWQPMLDSRVMIINKNTLKLNADTWQLDDNWLTVGQQIKFTSKTELSDGTTCLRTEMDTNNKIQRCVLFQRLSEFTPTYTELSDVRTVDKSTCRVDLRRSKALCDSSPSYTPNQQLKLAAKTTVLGIDYYVTEDDWDNGIQLQGVRSDRTRTSYPYTDIPLMYARVNRYTNKISHIDSWALDQPLQEGMIVTLSQKISIDGLDYYRTTYDSIHNIDRVILGERLSSIFDPFLKPRNLKTNKQTVSENPITGEICATVPANTILFFNSKTEINNNSYFRTKTMTDMDMLCSINSKALAEL